MATWMLVAWLGFQMTTMSIEPSSGTVIYEKNKTIVILIREAEFRYTHETGNARFVWKRGNETSFRTVKSFTVVKEDKNSIIFQFKYVTVYTVEIDF